MYYSTVYLSPIGMLTLVSHKEKLIGLWIEGQKHSAITVLGKIMHKDDVPVLEKSKAWLKRYFLGENPKISELSLSPIGSKFRQEVWQILCEIPYGEVTTYGAIAKIMAFRMGKEKMSAQAIGGAVAHNPIPIIIPCHRVIGANGSLTGYSGGIDKKVSLLKLEGYDV
ncbi:methylated-DNA--[protein]-cysteine S-methyltransferase [Hathewaya proteolytica]|nr:methylated-DNA--[protein]-cysteine S-methyltransferase [Hathewaya proteolytica]